MAPRSAKYARKPRVGETSIHLTVAAYLRRACPAGVLWWHTPNGEKRDPRTAGKLKAMGVTAGVPDFAFVMPNAQTAFLELKAADGGLSQPQIDFREAALAVGCGYATARSLDEVEQVLTRWLAAYQLRPLARIAA